MSEIEDLKATVKKLSQKATTMKMNLHDLSEELPNDFEKIPAVAKETFEAYAALTQARAKLKALESA
ncbi:CCE_0567 family metalloprotein [Mongoliimonas terrestris]|uniref:CCE_0567 family metalloprotein n=1 Tax=Mongoliimonas terrestris TaxID=1709001 RepID=UPI00094950D8|nr:CCE_0567 family metalloprotein [Mongoliimonas terrestris]